MERVETGRLLGVLKAAWPGTAITSETVTAYESALSEFDYPAVEAAARELIRTAAFFPRPAELRAAILARVPAWADAARWGLGTCDCGAPAVVLVHGRRGCDRHADALLDGWRSGVAGAVGEGRAS